MNSLPPGQSSPPPQLTGKTREEKLHLLLEELTKLNAQLEYLRLMLKIGARKP